MDHVPDSSTLRCQVRFCCNPTFFVNSNYYLLRIEFFFHEQQLLPTTHRKKTFHYAHELS
jgi:hypothetical protein